MKIIQEFFKRNFYEKADCFIFLLMMLISNISFAQETQRVSVQESIFYCGYSDRDMGENLCKFTQQSSFSSNADAEKAVDKILAPLGLPRNFVLVSCPKIENAIAITPDDGLRYIVYDNDFISRIGEGKLDWGAESILAHELGHHLCGHTLRASQSLEEQRKKELEADEFSGFILQKLGATLEQAQIAVLKIASEGDDSYSTHPNKEKRLARIQKGYEKAGGKVKLDYVEKEPGTEAFFHEGILKEKTGDLEGALVDYSKALELNGKNVQAWYNRGYVKWKLNDLQGALIDFSAAIVQKPTFGEALSFRGQVYYMMQDYNRCIADIDVAVQYLPNSDALALFYRGKSKEQLGDLQAAYSDLSNAILIESKAEFYVNRANVREKLGDLEGAIEDYDAALAGDTSLVVTYFNRGMVRMKMRDYPGAIGDFEIWLAQNPNDEIALLQVGLANYQQKLYAKAIASFSKLIAANPKNAKGYYYRGMSNKAELNMAQALQDYSMAIAFGYSDAQVYYSRAIIYYEQNEASLAIADLDKAISLNAEDVNFYYLRASLYQRMGEDAKACADFNLACARGHQNACFDKDEMCK